MGFNSVQIWPPSDDTSCGTNWAMFMTPTLRPRL